MVDAMRLVNLCPHEIRLETADGALILPPADVPARATEQREAVETFPYARDGDATVDIPIKHVELGPVRSLPDPEPDTFYIVSYPVAFGCPDRNDILVPDELLRNEHGTVYACRALAHVSAATSN